VKNLPFPKTKKWMQTFLGQTSYYWRIIKVMQPKHTISPNFLNMVYVFFLNSIKGLLFNLHDGGSWVAKLKTSTTIEVMSRDNKKITRCF
jgi:hypothetical protein